MCMHTQRYALIALTQFSDDYMPHAKEFGNYLVN